MSVYANPLGYEPYGCNTFMYKGHRLCFFLRVFYFILELYWQRLLFLF